MTTAELLTQEETLRLLEALNSLKTPDEFAAFLSDLLTPKELEEFAQRLEVATLLDAGLSYVAVSERTGASSTTVSRVSKCLSGPAGGYRLVLERRSY